MTGTWLKRLGATATNENARDAHGQLQGLLDYYNSNKGATALKEINWDNHRNSIHTPGVVDKIKTKYDAFMETEYTVDSAVSRTGGTQTE